MAILNKITEVLKTDLTKEISFRKKEDVILEETLVDKLKTRRQIYALGRKVQHSQNDLIDLIIEASASCPSYMDLKTTKIVILFGASHQTFWNIVEDVQRKHLPQHIVEAELSKIQQCVDALGTVLFFEDVQEVKKMQKQTPLTAEHLPEWSAQICGRAQYAVWGALLDLGLGANLQYYSDDLQLALNEQFAIHRDWVLRAELVFGSIEHHKGRETEYRPLIDENSVKIFD